MPGTAAGTFRSRQRGVAVATSCTDAGRELAFRDDHVGLEQHGLERDPLLEEGVEHGVQHHGGDLFAALDRVRSVHQDFWLDDRDEARFLTERGIARERMGVRAHAGAARPPVGDVDGDGLVRCEGEGFRAGIDLDSGHDAPAREHLGEAASPWSSFV